LLAAAFVLALSTGASAGPLPPGATSGVSSVQFYDNVTAGLIPGQCMDVQPPSAQVCDGAAGDEDPDAGEISVTQPFGSYVVGYDPVNQPADRLVKAPTSVACEVSAQPPLCSMVVTFNPTSPGPPAFSQPVNLFLTDQSGTVAPATCDAAQDMVTLTYDLPYAPPTAVGAFELGVLFDPSLVCADIEPGAYFQETPGGACFVSDMESEPGLERLGCIVVGDPETTSSSLEMMVVHVRAQPAHYATIYAGQDNGVSAQLLAVDCHTADLDGQLIEVLACTDYNVTVRRLEGDLNGDCAVDVRDQQLLAYRLGRPPIGPFEDRLDIEPPGGDGKLDIRDVQFVAGRHGSTCEVPLPPQPPRSSYLD
jgi:hypothetical protein